MRWDDVRSALQAGALAGGDGQQALLRAAGNFADGQPVALGDLAGDLDRGSLRLLLAATAHAAGSHDQYDPDVPPSGEPLPPLVAGTLKADHTRPMPYPSRPSLRPLPQFAGTARTGTVPSADLQARLEAYVLKAYAEGRSLREIAELVDRSQTAVRRALDKHHVPRRPSGAALIG